MFELTTLLVAFIFFVAGFVQGLSGFGSALVAMPFLTLLVDVKIAVPLCVLNGLLITSFLSFQLRNHLEREKILPLLIGCLPGVYVGVTFLKKAGDTTIKTLLGVMIITYALYNLLFFRPNPGKISNSWSYLAGFCTGVIGGAFSAGGPPVIIYTSLTDWSKDQIKATLSGFFLLGSAAIALAHAAAGLTTIEVLRYFSVSFLFVLAGVFVGSACYERVDRGKYIRIILAVLLFLGILMLLSANLH